MFIRSSTEHAGTIAAIDIGSNSIHLVVAKMDKDGHLRVLDADKMSVRLGAYLAPDGTMTREGQVKAISAIAQMAKIASAYHATIRAVATHALREATNHVMLIDAIHKKTGVKVEIIDGIEEARLVFLGMRYALPVENQLCLGMDIGGGSTEIILAKGEDIKFASSLKIGAVTLSKRHFGDKTPTSQSIRSLHQYINLRVEPLKGEVLQHKFKRAIASSGTAKAVASIHSRLFRGRPLTDENGYTIPVADVETMCKAIEELRSAKRIKEALGVEPARADILLAGIAIMREVSRVFGVDEWVVTTYGLREGVVVDCFRRMGGERLGPARDIRWQRIVELGKRWDIDEPHARQVAKLSLDIFDKLAPALFPRGGKDEWLGDRDILQVAAWLHEGGKFLSASGYHKHGYYLINHSRVLGFTQDERHLIGLMVLHHRKGVAKYNSQEVSGLPFDEFERVVFLSGILRMASALNRTRRGVITGMKIQKQRGICLSFNIARGQDPSVEFQQLERERPFIEKAFGLHLEVNMAKKSLVGIGPKRQSTKKTPKRKKVILKKARKK